MKKRLLSAIFTAAVLLTTGCAGSSVIHKENQSSVSNLGETPSAEEHILFGEDASPIFLKAEDASQMASMGQQSQEVRAVWLAYVNYMDVIKGMDRTQFTTYANDLFARTVAAGFNTIYVQVRPFGDALYTSQYFPWTRFLTGTEGKNPGYDPLSIMCSLADRHGLRIEAWLNPYRVRTDGRALSANNPAEKWRKAGSNAVLSWNGGLYYNPASPQAQQLIINGVKEIVQNYDVDGIHFDDYFYPTTDMSFDAASYKASGTKLTQAQWRRENVNTLVKAVYKAIKDIDPNCLFGISPQGNMDNNYNGQFIDVATWVQNPGYIDYICPQIYFGFKNSGLPFAKTAAQWDALITQPDVKLYIGLAAYKIGTVDQWAGESGKNEWHTDKNILSRMVTTSRQTKNYGGVAVYNIDSILNVNTAQGKSELSALMKVFGKT